MEKDTAGCRALNRNYIVGEYEQAIDYRDSLLAEVGGVIFGAYDVDGVLVGIKLQPTIKAIGYYDDAFMNYTASYNYDINEYGLGHGWRLGFSAIETYTAGYSSGKKQRLYLADGRVYEIGKYYIESELDDLKLSKAGAEYPGASYTLTYADGKKEYFDEQGRNIAIVDRHGNTIKLEYITDAKKKVVNQIKITDTVGNVVVYKEESLGLLEGETLQIPGLSSTRGRYNSKWTLTLNGDTVRTYYSYKKDSTDTKKLMVVEDEVAQYTQINTTVSSKTFNCFVAAPTTNDEKIKTNKISYIVYPDGTTFEVKAPSSTVKRENYGESGYRTVTNFGGIDYKRDTGTEKIFRDYVKFILGDYSGYYSALDEDTTYSSKEEHYRAKEQPDQTAIRIVRRYVNTYTFNCEHEKVKEETKAYTVHQDEDIAKSDALPKTPALGNFKVTAYEYNDAHLPTRISSKLYEPGITTSYMAQNYRYEYDSKGNVLQETLANGAKTTYTYSAPYNILLTRTYQKDAATTILEQNSLTADKKAIAESVVQENGMTTAKRTYVYDSHGRTTGITSYTASNAYATQTMEYGSGAQVTQIKASGVKTADSTSATGTPGFIGGTVVKKIAYNVRGWPISYTDGNGQATTISYDDAGRITNVRYPDGGNESYTYDEANRTVEYTNVNQHSFVYHYDHFGDLTEVYDQTEGKTLATYAYDSLGHRVLETVYTTVPNQNKSTYYYYDNLGRIIETGIRNADGSNTALETYSYQAHLGETTHTIIGSGNAPNRVETTYVDNMGNVTQKGRMLDGKEYIDTYSYDYLGNCTQYKSAYTASLGEAYSNKYTYDYAGNVLSETDTLGNTVFNTYDWAGNLLQTKDPRGNLTRYEYDQLGRLVRTTEPIGTNMSRVTKNYYDAAGNLTKQLNSKGTAKASDGSPAEFDTVSYSYDKMNRLLTVENPIDATTKDYTSYTYDTAGNITAASFGGRKRGSITTVAPSVTKYTYDGLNRVLSMTDALNKTETYSYDINGAMLTKLDRNGVQTQYAYDDRGRVISETIGSGTDQLTHTYAYALNGALLNETLGGDTVTYTYDTLGRMNKETAGGYSKNYTYNIGDLRTGFTVKKSSTTLISNTYTYDAVGRLTKVSGSGVTGEYGYDAGSNVTSVTYGNGVTQAYSYNAGNQVTELSANKGTSKLSRYQYGYDQSGRQTSVVNLAGKTVTYGYDGLGQLVSETRSGGPTLGFTYDSRGNRATLAENGVTTRYTYDLANRLLNRTKSGTTTQYTYDNNGNTLSARTGTAAAMQYTYDAANRLVGMSDGQLSAAYTYYANGLRKTGSVNSASTTYVWDGDQLVLEVSGGTTKKYIRGLGLVACVNGTSKTYYQYDAHGNVTQLTSSTGAVTKSYEYDAFGNELTPASGDTNPFRYCGEYFDSDIGTYYLRARNYDPGLGRFTQRDTYRGDIKNPISLNYYTYCYNNPVRYSDRSGNIPVETIFDIASIGWSLRDFFDAPSLATGANLLWDVAATFLPYIPGSYSVKGIRLLDTADGASDLARMFSKADNIKDTARIFKENSKSFVGSYKDIKKTVKSLKIKDMEVHHLIEKRFAGKLGIKNTNNMLSVALDKDTHKIITQKMRNEIDYYSAIRATKELNTKTAEPQDIWNAALKVYTDPELNMSMYLDQLKQEFISAGHRNLDWGTW